jgi:hypothetical protein
MKAQFFRVRLVGAVWLGLALVIVAPGAWAQRHPEPARGPEPRMPAAPPRMVVDRTSHGSLRHVDTHVVQRPVVEEHRNVEVRRPVEEHREVIEHRPVEVHRDVDVDWHYPHFWHDFHFGLRVPSLPVGWLTLNFGGVPYYYYDGIYYQQATGGYQEVYPPTGIGVPELPDGAVAVQAGNQIYYYAAGAFYVQQADGMYVIAQPPMGVVVPELPPGATQVNVNGVLAYQYNGVFYQPVFVNGVTQYMTFAPPQ